MVLQMGSPNSHITPWLVFYATGIVLLLYRPINRFYFFKQPKEGKHCQPSSTSFGLVDRFMGNYSATGRANSSSGRGKSITPIESSQPQLFVAVACQRSRDMRHLGKHHTSATRAYFIQTYLTIFLFVQRHKLNQLPPIA